MDANTILKNYLQQKQVDIFLVEFQCLQSGHFMARKASMMYTVVKSG